MVPEMQIKSSYLLFKSSLWKKINDYTSLLHASLILHREALTQCKSSHTVGAATSSQECIDFCPELTGQDTGSGSQEEGPFTAALTLVLLSMWPHLRPSPGINGDLGNGTAGCPALGRHNLPGPVPAAPEGMGAIIACQILQPVGGAYGAWACFKIEWSWPCEGHWGSHMLVIMKLYQSLCTEPNPQLHILPCQWGWMNLSWMHSENKRSWKWEERRSVCLSISLSVLFFASVLESVNRCLLIDTKLIVNSTYEMYMLCDYKAEFSCELCGQILENNGVENLSVHPREWIKDSGISCLNQSVGTCCPQL